GRVLGKAGGGSLRIAEIRGQDGLRAQLIAELVVDRPGEADAIRNVDAVVKTGEDETGVGGEALGPAVADGIVGLPVEVWIRLTGSRETIGVIRLQLIGQEAAAAEAQALVEGMGHVGTNAGLGIE